MSTSDYSNGTKCIWGRLVHLALFCFSCPPIRRTLPTGGKESHTLRATPQSCVCRSIRKREASIAKRVVCYPTTREIAWMTLSSLMTSVDIASIIEGSPMMRC